MRTAASDNLVDGMILLDHNDDVIRLWDGIGIRCQENTDPHADDRRAKCVQKFFYDLFDGGRSYSRLEIEVSVSARVIHYY